MGLLRGGVGRGEEWRGEDFVRLVSKSPCYSISDWLSLGFEFSRASKQPIRFLELRHQYCRTPGLILDERGNENHSTRREACLFVR